MLPMCLLLRRRTKTCATCIAAFVVVWYTGIAISGLISNAPAEKGNSGNVQVPMARKKSLLNMSTTKDDWRDPVVCTCHWYSPGSRQNSTCSPRADARGPNQKVISFVFFTTQNRLKKAEGAQKKENALNIFTERFFKGIFVNAEEIAKVYGPDWIMRVYFSISAEKFPHVTQVMCELECKYPHLDLCPVDTIDEWTPLTSKSFAVWRFLPMADELVSVFLSRDLDSRVTSREKAAVDDWLFQSSAALHVMRDHPYHAVKMLAGMWGLNLDRANRTEMKNYLRKIAEEPSDVGNKFFDQPILERIVWPRLKGNAVQHDSYFCEEFLNLGARPFPTKRLNEKWNFVGANPSYPTWPRGSQCPKQCRPPEHLEWTTC